MASAGHIPTAVDKDLSIAQLNINGLRNKIHDISHILALHEIDVLALSETKLDSSVKDTELTITDYRLFRRDRTVSDGGGGAALYDQNQISHKSERRNDLEFPDIEMIWLQIDLPQGKPVLVGCCYRPAKTDEGYLNKICETIRKVSEEDKDIFLLGDFNIDWLVNSPQKEKIASVSSECRLTQVMALPTRVTMTSSTCIDHIYTNIPELCSNLTSTVTGCSDHSLVGVTARGRTMESKSGSVMSDSLIEQKIMKGKQCALSFESVGVEPVLSSVPAKDKDKDKVKDKDKDKDKSESIYNIVKKCLSKNVFPFQWKESQTSPDPESSRPESLLPVLSQTMETFIFKQIQQHFVENELMSSCQYAHSEKYSTTTTLKHMTDIWREKLSNKELVGAVFLDFSDAFELISHDELCAKLRCYGFSESARSLIKHFLFCRKQRASYKCRSPRSSRLTSLLFCVFINDLPLVLKQSSIVMYDNEVIVYYSNHRVHELTRVLGEELQAVQDWVSHNKMVLHVGKLKYMIVGGRKSDAPQPRLCIQGSELEQVDRIKLRGVTLTEDLSCRYCDRDEDSVSGVAPKRRKK